MTQDQWLVFGVLGLTLVLFASGRLRHDLVALTALAAVALLGLAPQEAIFAGFGHPAVITVAAVLILSQMLNRSGVVDLAAGRLAPYLAGELAHILILCGVVAFLSAFINNVGALALMMPVALATATERGRNPSILLMPLAFSAILGGMTTLIGTPPNIIISGVRQKATGEPFALFDFTPVGIAVAVVGVIFVALIGWRLLPAERRSSNAHTQLYDIGGYLAELRIPKESPLVGRQLRSAEQLREPGVEVLSVIRAAEGAEDETETREPPLRLPAIGYRLLKAGDVLLIRATPETIGKIRDSHKLEVASEGKERALAADEEIDWRDSSLVEAVVSPTSPLIGRSVRVIGRISGGAATVIALARRGGAVAGRVREQRFFPGDVVLMQGEGDALSDLTARNQLWPLATRGRALSALGEKTNGAIWISLALFIGAVLLATFGVTSIGVAFTIAVVLGVVFNVMPARELYDSVDWPVIVLLGAMFPLGDAMAATGATQLIADSVAALAGGAGPALVMTLILIATMFLSDIINNAATAVLMGTLSIDIATRLDSNPDAFLMAVAIGASCAFLTPIGHQCNTLVMGPGGYRFTDYWRMGLPLEVIIVAIAAPLILLVWGV